MEKVGGLVLCSLPYKYQCSFLSNVDVMIVISIYVAVVVPNIVYLH